MTRSRGIGDVVTRLLKADSVEDIAGFVGSLDDQQISLKGWHPDSDVGGGTLYWDSAALKSTHNGGTIFSPTVPWTTTTADYLNAVGETDGAGTGVWVRLTKSINFNYFGAVLDNVIDDTSSIQATIDYAESLTNGGVINVEVLGSKGKCYLNTFLTLTSTSVAEIRKYAISVPANVTIKGPIEFTYDVDNTALGIFIQIFTVKGSNVTFDGPTFRNKIPGTQAGSISIAMNTKHDDDIRTGSFTNLIVKNCKFYDNIFATQVYFRDWGTSTMRGYKVIDCYCEPGIAGNTGAFDAHGNEGTRTQEVTYENNTVIGGTFASSYNCVGVQEINVIGNTARDNLYAACQIENWGNNVTISGNIFIGKGAASVHGAIVWIDDSANVVIEGNTINGDTNNKKGIYITHEGFTESVDGVSQDHTAFVTDNITIGPNAIEGTGIVSTSFGGGGGGSIGDFHLNSSIDGSGVGIANVVQLKMATAINVTGGIIKGGTSNSLQIDTQAGQVTNVTAVTTKDGGDGGGGYNLISGGGVRDTTSCIFNNGITSISGNYTSVNNGSGFVNDVFNGILRGVGSGTPEGVVVAGAGSIFQRIDGFAGLSFYVKESNTGSTGWVAK